MHSIKIKKGNVLFDKHRKLPPPLAKGVFCVFVRRERKSHQEVLFLWMML